MSESGPHTQIDSLTGIRAIAAALVVWEHMAVAAVHPGFTLAGALGVSIFFCLSGFLMALLYLGKPWNATVVRRYAIARFARIAPAYLTTVVLAYLIFRFLDPDFVYPMTLAALPRHLLFSGNISVMWSIPPEVQFYVLFVGIWFAIDAFVRKGVVVWWLIAAGVVATMYATRALVPGTFVGSKIHFFVLGCAAGHLRGTLARAPRRAFVLAGQGVFLALFLSTIAGWTPADLTHAIDFYPDPRPALVTAVGLLVLSYETSLSHAVLGNRVLRAVGNWSFSIYLLHEVAIYWIGSAVPDPVLNAMLIAAGILALAFLSYRFVETPGAAAIRRIAGRIASSRPSAR